jgi:hypothetical protein
MNLAEPGSMRQNRLEYPPLFYALDFLPVIDYRFDTFFLDRFPNFFLRLGCFAVTPRSESTEPESLLAMSFCNCDCSGVMKSE